MEGECYTKTHVKEKYRLSIEQGKAGDYITEMPGTIHTLYMGENSEVVFDVTGSIEFFNEDNTLRETMDGFSFWRMYVEHCEANNLKVNHGLWY